MAIRVSVITVVIISFVICGLGQKRDAPADGPKYGYEGDSGPENWGKDNPKCNGEEQSPINIRTQGLKEVSGKLRFNGFDKPPGRAMLKNSGGHTAEVSLMSGENIGLEINGKLYKFLQLHFHWGKTNDNGSEHQIDGRNHAGEMHMVFIQKKYDDLESAIGDKNGVAVLGVFLEVQTGHNWFHWFGWYNLPLAVITESLPKIVEVDSTFELKSMPAFRYLLPPNWKTYYTYHGSLTTPPCAESVTWLLIADVLTVSHKQIEAFRQLKSADGMLTQNVRPIQPLNNRKVAFGRDPFH